MATAGPFSSSGPRIRPARAEDHDAFVRLMPELATGDPIMGAERFARELVPTTLIAEGAEGEPVAGYAFFQIMTDTTYVRHLVTSPEARRRGVGRALMAAVAERGRAAGCTTWCLNVKPENVAALTLYESFGLARAHATRALVIAWSAVEAWRGQLPLDVRACTIEPGDEARVELATKLLRGQLAMMRALGPRVFVALEEHGQVVGATAFDPAFPGAYPFRVARPELAFVLLRALRASAREGDVDVHVVIEDAAAVADALVSAGARLKLDIQHMRGPLLG